MALAQHTADAYSPPFPGGAGSSFDSGREEQHIKATMAVRGKLSEVDKTVKGLVAQAEEIVEAIDQCGNQFSITILDDSHHFICAGVAYIDDGTHIFAPVSPMVQELEARLDTLSCSSTGFAIGSQEYLVWLEYDISTPEVYVHWGSQLPADTTTSKFIHVGTIPSTPANGSTRIPEMFLSGPAWLSGIAGSTHPFQLYKQLDAEGWNIYVRNGRVNGVLALNIGPWNAVAARTFFIRTTWTAVTADTIAPFAITSATLQEGSVEVFAAIGAPANVCPLIDAITGEGTDGVWYVPIGTQVTTDGVIIVENDNITRSIGMAFCAPCEFRNWPAG